MHNFTKRVTTNEGIFDVSYQQLSSLESKKYVITILEDDYAAPPFIIEEKSDKWRIMEGFPLTLWIQNLLPDLIKALPQNFSTVK